MPRLNNTCNTSIFVCNLFIIFFLQTYIANSTGDIKPSEEDTLEEELLIRPLADGHMLVHFQFLQVPSSSTFHTTFPKTVTQLAGSVEGLREFQLYISRGRWKGLAWGVAPALLNQPPAGTPATGARLTAAFSNSTQEKVGLGWEKLTNKLGAAFCSSISLLAAAPAAPTLDPFLVLPHSAAGSKEDHHHHQHQREGKRGDRDQGERRASSYLSGALGGVEGVCTEHLTPWLKLLPCGDRAGMAELLKNRPKLLRAPYMALGVHVRVSEDGGVESLTQTLTVVLQPASPSPAAPHAGLRSPVEDWSLPTILGVSKPPGACMAAALSRVSVELETSLLEASGLGKRPDLSNLTALSNNAGFIVHPPPVHAVTQGTAVGSVLLHWPLTSLAGAGGRVLKWDWQGAKKTGGHPHWKPTLPTFTAQRYLTGVGEDRGGVSLDLIRARDVAQDIETSIKILQVTPWFMRMLWHTLRVSVNGKNVPLVPLRLHNSFHWELLRNSNTTSHLHEGALHSSIRTATAGLRVRPAKDRLTPGVMELYITLPPEASEVQMHLEFEKAFLRVTEHPPDANHGFDVEGAVVTVMSRKYIHKLEESSHSGSPDELHGYDTFEQIFTDGLLVVVPVPDFSMPYNVITFTCTLVSLIFGSMMNVLLSRSKTGDRAVPSNTTKLGTRIKQWLSNRFRQSQNVIKHKET